MKITIGNYIIKTTGRGYECYKPVETDKVDKKTRKKIVYHRNQMFYSDITALLKCLPERICMSESEATTLAEYLDEIKRYHAMVETMVMG